MIILSCILFIMGGYGVIYYKQEKRLLLFVALSTMLWSTCYVVANISNTFNDICGGIVLFLYPPLLIFEVCLALAAQKKWTIYTLIVIAISTALVIDFIRIIVIGHSA